MRHKTKVRMKKKSILPAILLMGVLSGCQGNWQTEVEVMGGVTEKYVGEIDKNSPVVHGTEWLLRNAGNARLRIDSIKPSCDCLELHFDSSMTAGTGDYFPIRGLLHPEEGDTGVIYREVEVYGNFPSSPLVLSLKGEVVSGE